MSVKGLLNELTPFLLDQFPRVLNYYLIYGNIVRGTSDLQFKCFNSRLKGGHREYFWLVWCQCQDVIIQLPSPVLGLLTTTISAELSHFFAGPKGLAQWMTLILPPCLPAFSSSFKKPL